MKMYNIDSLLAKASAANIPVVTASAGGSNKYSMGVVNSKNNGKRLTFSKALSARLGLTETVHMIPVMDDGVLLVAKELPGNTVSCGSLSGEEKKICYSAQLVELLTKVFKLDFSEHVSRSFGDVQFETHGDLTIAVITMLHNASDEAGESA